MASDTRIPIWLDVDTGHDDAFALLLASQHPRANLLGVSTVYGNASLANTTHNTLAVLQALGRADIPVYAGASRPFCREAAAAPDIHGHSGLDGTTCLPTPTAAARHDRPAIEAMYAALIAQPPDTAWLVATGALTNVALLFAVHPDLAAHLAGLSIMGGVLGGDFAPSVGRSGGGEGPAGWVGNWTPWAEFNIYVDPEAARALLSENLGLAEKTTLISLDLTHQFLATDSIRRNLTHGAGGGSIGRSVSIVRRLFGEILMFFAKTYADVFGFLSGPPVHDPLAVAAALAPDMFADSGGERYAVQVITDGEHGASMEVRKGSSQCGRTVATLLPKGERGIRIPRSLDIDAAWKMLDQCLALAETAVADQR